MRQFERKAEIFFIFSLLRSMKVSIWLSYWRLDTFWRFSKSGHLNEALQHSYMADRRFQLLAEAEAFPGYAWLHQISKKSSSKFISASLGIIFQSNWNFIKTHKENHIRQNAFQNPLSASSKRFLITLRSFSYLRCSYLIRVAHCTSWSHLSSYYHSIPTKHSNALSKILWNKPLHTYK